jgi:chorismate dehydratase
VSVPVRLGAVDYLNVRPLVHGLDRRPDRVRLRFDLPSECARLLDAGEIDLGMVPSVAYLSRPGDRIVPGLCIGSDGAVASVAVFTRKPMRDVRTIALDTSSQTSAVLTRILCARRFNIAPDFQPHGPHLDAMLALADAALLIGDPALFADYRALGAEKIDLGLNWTEMTGLPFVWAVWAGRPDAASPETVALLQAAAASGRAHLDEIATAYSADPMRQVVGRHYLRENLLFDLTARAQEGLRTFYREALALGLVEARAAVEFFESFGAAADAVEGKIGA